MFLLFFFFFQAEDGIRDIGVTGVQTCALPIFMNWRLSKEGQAFQIAKLGNITSLKEPPAFPKGWDPKVIKVWVPNFEQFEKLREPWLAEWNKTYGYRQ